MSSVPVRILIADDHPIFRDGLRRLLESEPGLHVVAEAADGAEAVALAQQTKPDILLLDLAMPRVPGMEALRELAVAQSPVRTILLTASVERPQILQALQLGARGVVLKESATQVLLKSIASVMAGNYWVGRDSVPDLKQLVLDDASRRSLPPAMALPGAKCRLWAPSWKASATARSPCASACARIPSSIT